MRYKQLTLQERYQIRCLQIFYYLPYLPPNQMVLLLILAKCCIYTSSSMRLILYIIQWKRGLITVVEFNIIYKRLDKKEANMLALQVIVEPQTATIKKEK